MSAENSKTHMLQIMEEAWNKKAPAAFDDRIAPDFVCHTPDGDFKGLDGYKQLYNVYVTAFPDYHFTIDDVIAEGDKVSLRYTFAGTHTGPLLEVPATGKRVSVPGTVVTRVVDGKSVEEYVVWDSLGLVRQLGLVP